MRHEDYKIILDIFITCESAYKDVHRALWGGPPESVMLKQSGCLVKL